MQPSLAIVGGGPAGMMAAIRAAEALSNGARIVLFDKNDRLGRKIYLTGKGRCNLTNRRTWEDFAPHIHPNQRFLQNAFRSYDRQEKEGIFPSQEQSYVKSDCPEPVLTHLDQTIGWPVRKPVCVMHGGKV